jgi:predicted Na+-dependent transporter
MEAVPAIVVLGAALAYRPIVARAWRAGRLSDRTTSILTLGRFPVVCFLFGLILRVQPPFLIGLTILTLLPSALFYRQTLNFLREQAAEARRPA